MIEVAVTEPSGWAVPITETGAPGLRPASPEVVTVAFGGTVTVTVLPAKLVSVSRSALTEATVPTAIGACSPPAGFPAPAPSPPSEPGAPLEPAPFAPLAPLAPPPPLMKKLMPSFCECS